MDNFQHLVVATNNQGKAREIDQLLSGLEVEVYSQAKFGVTEVEETGLTFVENALIKARHAASFCEYPVLADDSGLAVDVLGGQPGIRSARYAGAEASDADNNEKLLAALDGVEDRDRGAQFICVMVLMRHAHDPIPLICQGSWRGRILTEPHGDNGFGYDPLFFVEEEGCTSAQLSAQRKNQLSHRGQALRAMVSLMQQMV